MGNGSGIAELLFPAHAGADIPSLLKVFFFSSLIIASDLVLPRDDISTFALCAYGTLSHIEMMPEEGMLIMPTSKVLGNLSTRSAVLQSDSKAGISFISPSSVHSSVTLLSAEDST